VLPAARTPGSYRIELVCLGNICRSPTAHVVLEQRLADAGLGGVVEVSSSGTGDWHVGGPMDPRAAAALTTAGYDASRHRARQHDPAGGVDLVLAMDDSNLADLGGRSDRTRKFRDFDPVGRSGEAGGDVPDPYYGGDDGFEEVLTMVERTASAIVDALHRERPWV
jgi:low molecular weight protein-tyrosine phosphatase